MNKKIFSITMLKWFVIVVILTFLYLALYSMNNKIQKLEKRVYELEYSMDRMTEFFNSDRSQLYK